MAINWGHKVMFGFVVFAAMISYLVYRSVHTRYDLVTNEYYRDELQYQQIIDGSNEASRLSGTVAVVQSGNNIMLSFPDEMKQTAVTGSILFYCANDARKDKRLQLQLNTDGVQYLDRKQLISGKYTVKIRWQANGKQYYAQIPFTLY